MWGNGGQAPSNCSELVNGMGCAKGELQKSQQTTLVMSQSPQQNPHEGTDKAACVAIHPGESNDPIVGRCRAMQEVFKSIGRIANQPVSLLIRGEKGTGKALTARSVWRHSNRQDRPIDFLDCGESMTSFEEQLFGRGEQVGMLESCDGGVLALLEVGYLQPSTQVQLLRLLTEEAYQRVGGTNRLRTDIRVVATSSHDLESLCASGQFRQDLFHQLNGFTIDLPPLRDRGGDIRLLLEHYLGCFNQRLHRKVEYISADAALALQGYYWPGNVRELETLLGHAMIKSDDSILGSADLPSYVHAGSREELHDTVTPKLTGAFENHISKLIDSDSTEIYANAQEYFDRSVLSRILRVTNGNQSAAAKRLGITRGSLRFKLKQLGLSIDNKVKVD